MAGKRARSSGSVRPAFGHVGHVDDEDEDRPKPGAQSRRDEADPDVQQAALRYGDEGGPATSCVFCTGRWTTAGAFQHDPACLAGWTVTARQAQRRQNGL